MSQMFYDAAPNATRVAPEREPDRAYPPKPEAVTLFGTCVVDLFFPEAGLDAIRLLEREGVRVHFPQEQSCCGQPAWTSGYRDEAKAVARAQLDILDRSGLPVVVPSGSCAGMFRHHYRALFADEPDTLKRVEALAERTFELTEFLLKVCKVQLMDRGRPARSPCTPPARHAGKCTPTSTPANCCSSSRGLSASIMTMKVNAAVSAAPSRYGCRKSRVPWFKTRPAH